MLPQPKPNLARSARGAKQCCHGGGILTFPLWDRVVRASSASTGQKVLAFILALTRRGTTRRFPTWVDTLLTSGEGRG